MQSNAEFLDKCRSNQPITCEDLGLPEWRNHTDGTVYICGGYTIYKTPDRQNTIYSLFNLFFLYI